MTYDYGYVVRMGMLNLQNKALHFLMPLVSFIYTHWIKPPGMLGTVLCLLALLVLNVFFHLLILYYDLSVSSYPYMTLKYR